MKGLGQANVSHVLHSHGCCCQAGSHFHCLVVPIGLICALDEGVQQPCRPCVRRLLCSLGAGAAALVSLRLRHHFPDLKCIAYSCPGSLVSKNLAHAMASFCTTVAVGKDAVPRASVATLGRLMDEMITALARCRQPKMRVLFAPWWRRHKEHFRDLFYDYREIPPEPAAVLVSVTCKKQQRLCLHAQLVSARGFTQHRSFTCCLALALSTAAGVLQFKYYESRRALGQPVSMYPPGKVVFLRPIKTRRAKQWDAVFVSPEDLIGRLCQDSCATLFMFHWVSLCSAACVARHCVVLQRQQSCMCLRVLSSKS